MPICSPVKAVRTTIVVERVLLVVRVVPVVVLGQPQAVVVLPAQQTAYLAVVVVVQAALVPVRVVVQTRVAGSVPVGVRRPVLRAVLADALLALVVKGGLVVISLKSVRDRLVAAEKYITTAQANNYIATQGTVSTTNNLAGLPLSHYNCNGGCSWSCSGSCSRGAGNR